MNNMEKYKVNLEDKKQTAMLVVCDMYGSFLKTNSEDEKSERTEFVKLIEDIAELKNCKNVSFSFISTDAIQDEHVELLREILNEKKSNIQLGNNYGVPFKAAAICEELKLLSKKYDVTDLLVLDDIPEKRNKFFIINPSIYENNEKINVDFISTTRIENDENSILERITKNKYKFNEYGKFSEQEFQQIMRNSDNKMGNVKYEGLGKCGYMQTGLTNLKNNLMKKKTEKGTGNQEIQR